jgi:SAM-dependent methyltransferase
MTELEHAHFAGTQKTSKASLHLTQERSAIAELNSYVASAMRFAPRGKWLDIGCGTGTLIMLIRARGVDIEGIELTQDRRNTALRETRVRIYDAPVEDLRLPSQSYAAVSLINVFSHLTSPTETLREIRRILMPGGIILLVSGEIGPNVRRRHAFSWDLGDHLYFLGEKTADRYAAKLGLELIHREKVWGPATTYTHDRFLRKGRSTVRNVIKEAIAYTPGALRLLRWYRLTWHDADNPIYSSTLVLRKAA